MSSNYKFNIGVLIGAFLFAALLLCSSCIFVRVVKPTEQPAPCCEEELPPLSPFDLISEE